MEVNPQKLKFQRIDGRYAVCRLLSEDAFPAWAVGDDFVSFTRTAAELSIVCAESCVPDNVKAVKGWSCLRVSGTMDFSLVGVVASITSPIAAAGLGVFVVSTFDTDYLLVKEGDLQQAIVSLVEAGHEVS